MGFLTEIAIFFLFLIGIYTGLHDLLGLNVIPYDIFDTILAPSFVAFLFITIANIAYWLYRINNKPLKKRAVNILKLAITVFALGIFFTSLPQEALSTFKLIIGKLFLLVGLALGGLAAKINKRQEKSKEFEQKLETHRLY